MGKHCNHGPNGRCLHCPSFEKKEEDKEKKQSDVVKHKKCQHGPNGKCINCMGDDEKDKEKYVTKKNTGKCDHGPNAKCLHCIEQENENIKHLSFD